MVCQLQVENKLIKIKKRNESSQSVLASGGLRQVSYIGPQSNWAAARPTGLPFISDWAHLLMSAAPRVKPCSAQSDQWTLASQPRAPNVDALEAPRPQRLRLAGPHEEPGRKALSPKAHFAPLGQVNSYCYPIVLQNLSGKFCLCDPLSALEFLPHLLCKQTRGQAQIHFPLLNFFQTLLCSPNSCLLSVVKQKMLSKRGTYTASWKMQY